jgi:hypothetical protein
MTRKTFSRCLSSSNKDLVVCPVIGALDLAKTSSHWSGIRIHIGSWNVPSRDPFRVSVYVITGSKIVK